jgi:response regulator RpfG family c-di-GMP phosphodiesterase
MIPKRETLLLVDDEENVLTALSRVLHSEGYQILTANCGSAALKILEKEKVHLVLSDHRMPGMCGIDLLKQVQARYPHIIRFLLTGVTNLDEVIPGVNSKVVQRYIQKPCVDDFLKLTIRTSLMFSDKK